MTIKFYKKEKSSPFQKGKSKKMNGKNELNVFFLTNVNICLYKNVF